jgi:hypothetical protein
MVFTAARGGTERGSVLAATATTKVWKSNKKYPFLRKQRFMRERDPFFRKGREVSEKERNEREQRNKKLGKMLNVKVERGI